MLVRHVLHASRRSREHIAAIRYNLPIKVIYCLSFVSKFFYFNRPRFRAIVLLLCYNSSNIFLRTVGDICSCFNFIFLRCGRVTPTTINTVAQALHMNVPSDLLRGFIGRSVTLSHNFYFLRFRSLHVLFTLVGWLERTVSSTTPTSCIVSTGATPQCLRPAFQSSWQPSGEERPTIPPSTPSTSVS